VVSPDRILEARQTVYQIYIDPKVERYIVDIVVATRRPVEYGLDRLTSLIRYGASPRATIYTTVAAKAHAFVAGEAYVTPDHVRAVVRDVLRHRIIVSYEAEAEEKTSDDLIDEVLETIEVP
jgi:MoxR-like ATPase